VAALVARNGLAPAKGASPHQLWTAFKNDAQIIGGHWYGLCQGKTATLRQVCDLGDIPYAPLSVLRSQPNVELFVARGGVTTVANGAARRRRAGDIAKLPQGAAAEATGLYRPHFRYDLNSRHFAGLRSLTSWLHFSTGHDVG
jgi:hypothetical protein